MTAKSSDEFWNTSSSVSFNFDDDFEMDTSSSAFNELVPSNNAGSLVTSQLENSSLNTLPIHSLLTKRNLDAVLDDVRTMSQSSVPSVQETVLKMFLGMPFSLSIYRSLSQKLELLDEAVASEDGNVILMVLLFLRKSLELFELYSHLSTRKTALRHYLNYLMREFLLQELSYFYLECGNFNNLIYLFYVGLDSNLDKNQLHSKLQRFLLDYDRKLSSYTNSIFTDYKSFIKWQLDNCEAKNTVTEQLASLCRTQCENNFDSSSFDKQINEFKGFVKMSDFQYEWILVNAFSAFKMWKKLTTLFIKPNWLTKRNSIKSVINAELFISTLHRHMAPIYVLEEFLSCIVDNEVSLLLAKKFSCHKFVVNMYASQRDRCSIQSYKVEIPRDSDEYAFAESIIASDKRWKN